jgi:photosystem II stability/assembly factor-like uncharacterized protein
MFKSTDSGATWTPINEGLGEVVATRAPMNALVLDPDSGTLYLATSGYGVFKSSDGGATWTPWNEALAHLDVRLLALVRGGSALYASTPAGVFKMPISR